MLPLCDSRLRIHSPPGAGNEPFAVKLFVNDARGRGHPLDVAGTDGAVTAGRIAVLEFALVDNRDGLESPVRVLTDAAEANDGGFNTLVIRVCGLWVDLRKRVGGCPSFAFVWKSSR